MTVFHELKPAICWMSVLLMMREIRQHSMTPAFESVNCHKVLEYNEDGTFRATF